MTGNILGADRMPLLGSVVESSPYYEDVAVLHINHDMANSYRFSEMMTRCFGKVVMVGCAYQNSLPEERQIFSGDHLHGECTPDGRFRIYINEQPTNIYCPGFVESVDMMITVAVTKFLLPEIRRGKRLLILEDGGYHSSVIDNLSEAFPELEQHITGSVEQTTSGSKIISSRESWRYPMISVARSDIKMGFESIFIGQRIVEELSSFLYTAEAFLNFSPVTVIGYGIIGRSTVRCLAPYKCRIRVVDTDKRVAATAAAEGCRTASLLDPAAYEDNMIIIGCVGRKTFGRAELDAFFRSGSRCIYLASGSSKDIEFKDILNMISGQSDPGGYAFSLVESGEYFKRYAVSYEGDTRTVCIIADGRPVNFCRKGGVSLTDKVVDLIFSEMLQCGLALLSKEHQLDSTLHILGSEDSGDGIIDEEWLLRKWFEMNRISIPDSPLSEILDYHPNFSLLRKKVFEKDNMRALI